MAEVMEGVTDALDKRRDRMVKESSKEKDKAYEEQRPRRDRERDSRERREAEDRLPAPRAGGGGGMRSDYNHHRSSPGRDYKRRHSPSPPPPYPPPRRHSPPPRRSPPYKRSRRDDPYERRGSPRYGYENLGGYDRMGGGGRGGYGDDRLHSRQMGRLPSSGFQDYPAPGRSGFGEMDGPREGLMTYKQFIAELEDDVSPAEAEKRYDDYRTGYITTQKRAFFDAHKDEDWLKDKYDPFHLEGVIQRRNENAKTIAKEFLVDLQNDALDVSPSATACNVAGKGRQSSEPNSDNDIDVTGKRRRHGRGPAKETDNTSNAPKAPSISSDPRRVKKDIEISQALIRKLDAEKGITENILGGSSQATEGDKSIGGSMGLVIVRGSNAVKGLEGLELLDVTVTYLWRVHGLDYYGMLELKDPPKGLRHIRTEGKNNHDEQSAGVAEWEKKLESVWQARLQGKDPLEIMAAKDKLESATTEVLEPYVRKIRDEKYGWKYGCGAKACSKLFHASEFVLKHLRLKHPELITELTAKVREELYFQNYMNDSDAPGITLSTQQPGQRERLRRRKNSERGRDREVDHSDRPSRRDVERVERVHEDDRYERDDESPSREHPAGQDAHRDSSMYERFPGPGMHAPPFGSDIPPPPPVLMPVPGAGPLGPFVPAPPEVAMQMLRDQGDGPFHPNNNGGPRGRKGRSGGGPHMGGMMEPPVILPVSAPFRQDPRRIRSYHDLDAPDDEVTVIDYRSL